MTKLDKPQAAWADDRTLERVLSHWAETRAETPAVVAPDRTLTWAQSVPRLFRLADALRSAGVGPGTRVAWLSRNSLPVHETFVATLLARGCAVPLPSMASSEALALMVRDSDARVFCVSKEFKAVADGLRAQGLPVQRWFAFDFADPDYEDYEAFLASGASGPGAVRAQPPGPDDEFNIIYSSGTTGTPKGILHRHRMRMHQANVYENAMPEGSVNLVSTPLYSNTTIVMWFPALVNGATNVLMPKFDPEGWQSLAERHRVTHAMLVPVQYDRLLRSPALGQHDLSSLRFKFCTSAPMREDLKRRAVFDLPGRFTEYYGLTEGGIATVLFGNDFPDKLASVGKCYTGELKVIDEQGNELPAGRTGEVVGRNDYMMEGYVNRDEATSAMLWRDADGRLFFRSGDVGRLDEDGFLYLSDRKKDVIISGGFNIYATDLETVLARHPAVHEVAVIGIPSEQWGETPLALVVLEPGATDPPEAILAWANERLGKGQRLSGIELRDSLPKSEIGKTLKRELRQKYWGQ